MGLRQAGHNVHLTIAGNVPSYVRTLEGVNWVGFLDKNNQADRMKLASLYRKAQFLLVPSKGDCTPMVVAEALSCGTPAIAHDTGGIKSLIAEGCGHVFPVNSSSEAWVNKIHSLLEDGGRYWAMASNAITHAERQLSWDSWAKTVEGEILSALTSEPVRLSA